MIIDLFAGPGGWDLGLGDLDVEVVGLESDSTVCATRDAAGLLTKQIDLRDAGTTWGGAIEGLIASPPCQAYSVAGMKRGMAGGAAGRAQDGGELVDVVPQWVTAHRPRWVACEQVPSVLPIWQEHAAYYQSIGYETWTGTLNAANYGLPQSRQRAFLIASLDRQPHPPVPTHAAVPRPALFGRREPWITMIDGIGRRDDAEAWIAERLRNKPGNTTDDGRWVLTRPATTIAGWARMPHPGQNTSRFNQATKTRSEGMLLTEDEGLTLQGFPADYPIAGTNQRARWSQIGNAVPPPLAKALVEVLL